MIKYFQKLKAKKGFTLVELIVVIAIIGVLAAILIPTMLGYVTQSKVTSANSTAASIKNEIDNFLTNADTHSKGMKKGTEHSYLTFTIASGAWNVSVQSPSAFVDSAAWVNTAGHSAGSRVSTDYNNASLSLVDDLADLFPEVKTGIISAALVGGKCVAVAYTTETATKTGVHNYTEGITSAAAVLASAPIWDASTPGICGGYIVGTAPALGYSATSA